MGIMNGTTVKEGRDDIIAVLQAAKATGRPREHFYFHVDGAYSSVYLRLIDAPAKITPSFDHDIDSISASGHKFIGSQRTTGLLVMRKEHSEAVKSDVEYISSVNKTMGGSRDAFPIIELWLAIKYRGKKQMEEWARACILKARGVAQTMRDAGVKDVLLNEYATTVYFRQPSKALMDKYHLAPEGDNCHLIVEPHTLSEFGGYGSLDEFMVEFLAELR
jgi:histidine decarboxylase